MSVRALRLSMPSSGMTFAVSKSRAAISDALRREDADRAVVVGEPELAGLAGDVGADILEPPQQHPARAQPERRREVAVQDAAPDGLRARAQDVGDGIDVADELLCARG